MWGTSQAIAERIASEKAKRLPTLDKKSCQGYHLLMLDIQVIDDPAAATVALEPMRSRLLSELAAPASAATLATRVGLARQKVNYHLRALEAHGLVRLAEERKWGGLTERLLVATAASYVVSPSAMGPVAVDPDREVDRLSASYLIALGARVVREVGDLVRRAKEAGKRLATLSVDTEVRFRSAADRAAFSNELTEAIAKLVSKYHDESAPGGRAHRLVVVAHPLPAEIRARGAIMSVKKEASGRRSIQVEVEVPGTPEEVWQAIATGPGISSWFVPAEFEERDGKPVALTLTLGPGMELRSEVTAWDPPRMFASEGAGWFPGSPPIATEWSVEARAGGVCVVRVVQSLFASTDDWDDQLIGTESGWPGSFRILRLYLTHFRGQRSAFMQFMAPVAGTPADAWATLTAALGFSGVGAGQRWAAPAGVPALGGVVEDVNQSPPGALLRLDQPGPGIAALFTMDLGETVMAALSFYLYGDQAAAIVARETPRWQAWIQERFPMPTELSKSE